jgi:hypothetical protein
MASIAPQHSDLDIIFDPVKFNDLTDIDLSAVDKFVFSIAKSNPGQSPKKILDSSVPADASRFVVDNVNKQVTVTLLSIDINNDFGKFFINLYAYSSGRRVTHLTKELDIQKTVNYEV